MSRRFVLLMVIASLSGCVQHEPTMSAENRQIIVALVTQLPDQQSAYEKFAEEHPDEVEFLGRLVDHRLCVARHVAGAPGELVREDENPNAAPNPSKVGERWEESKTRTPIPKGALPNHLRWDGPLSYCPSGVIRLGTPEIAGDTARVFIENHCSGWCGWGGEMILKRTGEQWRVTENINWWQA